MLKCFHCMFCILPNQCSSILLLIYTSNLKKLKKDIDTLEIKCMDWDRFSSDDRMGLINFNINDIQTQVSIDNWFALVPQKSGDPVSGELHISLTYNENWVKGKSPEIWDFVKAGDFDSVVKCLEDREYDLGYVDVDGQSILHYAIQTDSSFYVEIIDKLIEDDRIDVNHRDISGNTCFHIFCKKFMAPAHVVHIFDKFIMRRVELNAVNNVGESALHYAVFNQVVRILMVEQMVEHDADLNIQSDTGETPLHYAIRLGRLDLVKHMLIHGANIELATAEGRTAYQLAKEIHSDFPALSDMIKNGIDLIRWLQMINMDEYIALFLEQELYKTVLPAVTEEELKLVVVNDEHRSYILEKAKEIRILSRTETMKKKAKVFRRKNKQLVREDNLRNSLKHSIKGSSTVLSWEIDPQDLEFSQQLGTGASGEVFKGLYRGSVVAIKQLKSMRSKKMKDEFNREFEIMINVESPYIVTFLGASIRTKICMVMEFCERGSLFDVLRDEDFNLEWELALNMMIETVKGLYALHSAEPEPIMHRDMKTLNVLVTHDLHCKLCDFGLSRFDNTANLATLKRCRGTYAYIAPEAYSGSKYTFANDIYSIGVMLYEMANSIVKNEYEIPYREFEYITMDFHILVNVAEKQLRPTLPDMPREIKDLIELVWNQDPEMRPTAEKLVEALELCLNIYIENREDWDSYSSGDLILRL
eukprot:TRINITY_DN2368_c0_g1_i2.p1 TRINITY_DN2368_c0_g1~~TRINITY_DN2368_c0_g1_i2.p1  ORF type:complete len:702 (+),score=156.19 TRINITY_DN2368_c0_g1_i2:186-2291(+)